LADARVSDFNPKVVPTVAMGNPVFPAGAVLPNIYEDEETHEKLAHCSRDLLAQDDEASFLTTPYVEMLGNSVSFSNKKRSDLVRYEKKEANCVGAPELLPRERMLAMRA
jgi:hypothetical protein